MIKHNGLFYTAIYDCDENEGGLFVQVYEDKDLENEVDYFVIDRTLTDKNKDEHDNLLGFLNKN